MENNSNKKVAYMTIDDAPYADFRERVDYLEARGIKAIWYGEGKRMEEQVEDIIYAIKKGHIIGNHSYDHPHFSEIDVEEGKRQIKVTDEIIENIYKQAGVVRPIKTFRFPYLDHGEAEFFVSDWEVGKVKAYQAFLKDFGYTLPELPGITYDWYKNAGFLDCISLCCTYDSFDWSAESKWAEPGYETKELVMKRLDERVPEDGRGLNDPGSNEIVMMHAYPDMDLWTGIIEGILSKGITFEMPI